MYQDARSNGNLVFAAALLEQAAKEAGYAYSNKSAPKPPSGMEAVPLPLDYTARDAVIQRLADRIAAAAAA
jgi:hypothetical protein